MTQRVSGPADTDKRQMHTKMKRRDFLSMSATGGAIMLGGLTLPAVMTPARGEVKTITVGMYSGPRTEIVKKTVIKRLEEKHNAKFLIDEGWTTDQLARLRASKRNPVHTVMWMDDIGVNLARKEGLVDKLPEDKIPNLANVTPKYIVEGGYGVGIDLSTVALSYSTSEIPQPPTSWSALWNPEYAGTVSVPSIRGTHGVNLVVVAAALETGKPLQEAQYESDAAFKKLAELKPNLHSIFPNTALVMAEFQRGEVIMVGPFYSSQIWPYIDAGLVANHIIPQEGGFAGLSCQTLVHDGPYPELGAEFINEILSNETQQMLAQKLSNTPVVPGLELPPETLARIPYGKRDQGKLFLSDWEFINGIRPEWTERWNQVFS